MGKANKPGRFDGARWFEKQVRMRTREALDQRGIEVKTHHPIYVQEYQVQLKQFRKERAAVKQRKAEKRIQKQRKQKEICSGKNTE